MYLHEAIAEVLRESGRSERLDHIVKMIARGRLYRRKDGGFPDRNQVSARVSKYPELFHRRGGGTITLYRTRFSGHQGMKCEGT